MSTIQKFIGSGRLFWKLAIPALSLINVKPQKSLASLIILTLSGHLVLNSQLICYHRYEFTIGWFGLTDINGVTEQV